MDDSQLYFNVVGKSDICDMSSRIWFKSTSGIKVRKFYWGLSLAGKCVKITSMTNFIAWYYTICNCLSRYFLDEYHEMIIAVLEETKFKRKYPSI